MVTNNDTLVALPPRAQLRKSLTTNDTKVLNDFLKIVERQQRTRHNDLRLLLQVCAELGKEEFVRTLIARNADVNASTNTTLPALLYALRGSHLRTAHLLLLCGADPGVVDSGERHALIYTVLYGSLEMLEMVHKFYPDIDACDKQGKTALLHAASIGKADLLQWLLDRRGDITMSDKKGMTAVMVAAANGHGDVLKVLLRNFGPLEAADKDGKTAVLYAAANHQVNALELLLDYGADPRQPDNDGKDPMLHAMTQHRQHNDKERIVRMLLTAMGGMSNDTESVKYLRSAALAGQNQILKLLLEHKANVNAEDGDGRSVLWSLIGEVAKTAKHARTADDTRAMDGSKTSKPPKPVKASLWNRETVLMLLESGAEIKAGRNESKGPDRTPLHEASAMGHLIVVNTLLEYLTVRLTATQLYQYVNRQSSRGKTALHLAAQNGHDEIVEVLLKNEARIDAVSEGNWTPLLNAAKMGHGKVVEILLNAAKASDVNARTSSGMTALHWAAEHGHKMVVELLLRDDRSLKNAKDTFNTTPLLRAGLHKHDEVFELFRPHLLNGRMPKHAESACSMFKASVVDFYIKRDDTRTLNKPCSVRHVLYDVEANDPTKFAITTSLRDIQEGLPPDIRWIHLPANNLAWAETLMTKMLIEKSVIDVGAYQYMLQLFGQQQHRGSKVHSRFMRPLCRQYPHSHSHTQRQRRPPKLDVKDSSTFDTRSSFVTLANSPKPDSTTQSDCDDRFDTRPKEVGVIFMPYLHWETSSNRQIIRHTVHEILESETIPPMNQPTRDECLIRGYLRHATDLHLRRTLDQFKHHSINTDTRDRDQVVYRHHLNTNTPDPTIFMIDQMWIWIFEGIVLTCFPERFGQPVEDPVNLFDGIISDISSKSHPPIRSTHDLAAAITNRCIGSFDRHQWGDEGLDHMFFEIFELTIGTLTRRSTALLARFEQDATNAARWLKDKKYQAPQVQSQLQDRENEEDQWLHDSDEMYGAESQKPSHIPVYVDRLLNISKETKLLIECKDIEDELGILTHVLDQQREVLKQMSEVFANQGLRKKGGHQKRLVEQHMADIERMQKQADLVNRSLTQVLDLKQKHANAIEARFARDQAEDTARQGQTIMVFTIVTIVFLPLSFMAAFFAINITEFPHDSSNGGDGLAISWVSKYTFGIGFAVSVPMILVAFVLGDVRGWNWRMKNWFALHKQERHSKTTLHGIAAVSSTPIYVSQEKLTAEPELTDFAPRRRISRQRTNQSRATFETSTTAGDSMV